MLFVCEQDPEESPEAIDELLTRQFSAIESALSDACPAMRAAVVGGLCRLLNDFWELIPAAIVAGNIKRLTSQASVQLQSPSAAQLTHSLSSDLSELI